MQFVKKIAGEEFASHVARVFSNNDSPYGHVDVETITNAFRTAILTEAVEAAKPLHALPAHCMVGVMRRFLGPISYEREIADVFAGSYGTPGGGPVNAALLLEDFNLAVAPPHVARPVVLTKIDLRATIVGWIERMRVRTGGSPTRTDAYNPVTPMPLPQLAAASGSPPGSRSSAAAAAAAAASAAAAAYERHSMLAATTAAYERHSMLAQAAAAPASASSPYGLISPVPPRLPVGSPPRSGSTPAPAHSPQPMSGGLQYAAEAAAATLNSAAAAAAGGSALDPLRVAGSALTNLIAQATAAAHDHERALSATSEAAVGWQARASAAEAEATQLSAHRSTLHADLISTQHVSYFSPCLPCLAYACLCYFSYPCAYPPHTLPRRRPPPLPTIPAARPSLR